MNQSCHLSLVINELATNSLKYATIDCKPLFIDIDITGLLVNNAPVADAQAVFRSRSKLPRKLNIHDMDRPLIRQRSPV